MDGVVPEVVVLVTVAVIRNKLRIIITARLMIMLLMRMMRECLVEQIVYYDLSISLSLLATW